MQPLQNRNKWKIKMPASRALYSLLTALFFAFLAGCGGGGGGESSGTQKANQPVGSLYISTEPSGATVYLDGENKGLSPLVIDGIPVGGHKIKVSKNLSADVESDVMVIENETVTLNFELTISSSSTPVIPPL